MASVSKRSWTYKGEKKTAWVVRYVDGAGGRRLKTFDLKRDADSYRLKVEVEIEKGSHVAPRASIKVAAAIDQYLEAVEARQREGRKMGAERMHLIIRVCCLHIRPHLGNILLSDLSFADVERWTLAMAKKGTMSATTVESYLLIVRGIVDFAVKRGYVAVNVVRDVIKERGSAPRARIKTFTKGDVEILIRVAAHRPPKHHRRSHAMLNAFVHIAAFCGLRIGEIKALTLGNVDFEEGYLRVRHNLTAGDVLKGPKTAAGVRNVPMASHVRVMLQDWTRDHYQPNARKLIFRADGGAMVCATNFRRNDWYPLLTRAGLAPADGKDWLHFHALRHFAASFMIEKGLPLTETAQVLGHERFDMTLQVYAHPLVSGHRRLAVVDQMASDMLPAAALPVII